jgi:hypothetical protein
MDLLAENRCGALALHRYLRTSLHAGKLLVHQCRVENPPNESSERPGPRIAQGEGDGRGAAASTNPSW